MCGVNNVLKCIIKSNGAQEQRVLEGREGRRESEWRARAERSNFREGNCQESRLKSLSI